MAAALLCSSAAAALLVLLLLQVGFSVESSVPELVGTASIDCTTRCAYRCSKASRQKMCVRACNTCCRRCDCVPPGTSGNEDVCPCYANMKTHGGRHKCP